MNHRNLFIFNGIVCVFFGLGLMFAPVEILKIYAANLSEVPDFALVTAQGYGTLIFALAIALFSALKARESLGRRALLLIVCLGNGMLAILHAYATMKRVENSMGWTLVLLVGFLAVWGGMLLMREKPVNLQS
ncbi:MAG: hypothetical protein KDC80_12535 [Saprospiraceae bacterium]|nr:hypothetical protein [Saprospiraceae bacterium]